MKIQRVIKLLVYGDGWKRSETWQHEGVEGDQPENMDPMMLKADSSITLFSLSRPADNIAIYDEIPVHEKQYLYVELKQWGFSLFHVGEKKPLGWTRPEGP